MKIYRMQNSAGKGPYSGQWDCSWRDGDHSEFTGRPGPTRDAKLMASVKEHECPPENTWEFCDWMSQMQFGFESMEALCKWFTDNERHTLYRRGFIIIELEVPDEDVALGDFQLMYFPARAQPSDRVFLWTGSDKEETLVERFANIFTKDAA